MNLIATQQPTDLQQLYDIRGVGPPTIEQHGAAIITIVRSTS
ncbi:MAG: HRDC domain-containing protein [Candidatus Latescibacteria bacterium]|nr:HRDC domain-containing protein [Candidatus Latescibacterota bacterium]